MAVKQILQLAGNKMGLSAADPSQRATLLRYLNEAARELYDQSDAAGVLKEQVFKVNGDQTITCPWYVGPIRGARELNTGVPWHINKLRPRFNQFNWIDAWRNLRLVNTQALQSAITNQSVVQIVVDSIETPAVVVTIVGPTDEASRYKEEVTMDSSSITLPNGGGFCKLSTGNYNDITYLAKNKVSLADVKVLDADDNLLSTIPNCQLEANYQVIDVSSCPWLSQNVSVQDNYMEILYKEALTYLFNDQDTFPSNINFDHILVNKMMQLSKEEQDKTELALAYDAKATRSLARVQADQNKATEDMVSLVANPHDTLLSRIGSGMRRRASMFRRRG